MNKKSLLALALTLALVSSAHAQPDSLWSRTYGGRYDDECYSLVQTADGGFALAGNTVSFNRGPEDFWLVRTDENGDNLWSCTYGGGNSDQCNSLIQTADGGYALAGNTQSFGAGGADFWLVRTDKFGDSLWSHTYGGESWDECLSLVQTVDGGFVLAGYTSSFGAGYYDFWLVRTDENGDSLWSRTYGGEDVDFCSSIIQTADGEFALAGDTWSFGAGESDFWVVRTDENGDSLWSRTYGGQHEDYCSSLIQTACGDYVLAGYTYSFGAGSRDFWLVQMDEKGISLWSHTYGGEDGEFCSSLIPTADGEFALAGDTRSFGAGGADFWLVRTDKNGDSLWSRTYSGRYEVYCSSLVQTADGGYALAGYTYRFGPGGRDFWLVKCGPSKTLTGTVVVNQTGAPILGATVSIPDLRIETTTDTLGRFRLEKVIWDTVAAHIEVRGYTTIDSLVVTFSDTSVVDIDVRMLHPEFVISPDFVDIFVTEGEVRETVVQVSNPGDGPLVFNAYDDADWLEVTPTEGQVEAGDSLEITIALDATGLVVDRCYDAYIQFEHNTLVEGPIWLDVTMRAEPNSVSSEETIPLHFGLEVVFPNPFNLMATITCDLPEAASVTLSAYDLGGREVAAIYNGKLTAGQQRILWGASGLSSGIYLVKLQSAENIRTARVTLVR